MMSKLYDLLKEAHEAGARRGCLSTQVLLAAHQGNGGDGWKSCMAAMNSMGGKHAPIHDASVALAKCLNDPTGINNIIYHHTRDGGRIPGFGCDFVNGQPDPMLEDVADYIFRNHPKMYYVITEMLVALKNKVYPNLAIYTAAYIIIERWPANLIDNLLFQLRHDVWMTLLIETENQPPQ